MPIAPPIKVSTMNGKPWGVRLRPMQEELVGWFARPLLLLQGAVGFRLFRLEDVPHSLPQAVAVSIPVPDPDRERP